MRNNSRTTDRYTRGTVLLPALLMIGAMLGIGALAVDLGMLLTAKDELQTAADAAALAGVKELAFGEFELARDRAVALAALNGALGEPVAIDREADVTLGYWLYGESRLVAGVAQPNAVQVVARRLADQGTGVTTWFAQSLGVSQMDAGAEATAIAVNRDLVLVIDRSGSMGDRLPCGTPGTPAIVPTREAAAQFLRGLAESTLPERAGLVTYALEPRVEVEIVNVDEHLSQLVNATLDLTAAPCGYIGSTNTGEAIDFAVELYLRDANQGGNPAGFGQKLIVLLSDGLANAWPEATEPETNLGNASNIAGAYAVEAAETAASAGITIHTIMLGEAPGAGDQLRAISAAAGGLHMEAPTPQDLDELFQRLARLVQVALVH